MTPSEQLRLATALVHTVPGADLHLLTESAPVVVSRHPAADVDPCELRRAVVAVGRCPDAAARLRPVRVDRLGGALNDIGAGVYLTCHGAREQRWVATLLPYERVVELLGDIATSDAHADVFEASVRPDLDLGVTVVRVGASESGHSGTLDEIAAQAAAAFVAEELAISLAEPSRTDRVDEHTRGLA